MHTWSAPECGLQFSEPYVCTRQLAGSVAIMRIGSCAARSSMNLVQMPAVCYQAEPGPNPI